MPDLPSFQDLFNLGRDEILSRNAKLSLEAVEREGMDANILVASQSAMGDEVVGQIADLSAALYLDSALDEALDHLVFDRYGMVRKAASTSLGSVQFSTTAASPATFTIPVNTIVQTATGVQFVTVESAIFLVGSTGPLTVAVRSVLAGSSQNVKIGTITSIVSQITSAPTDLVVSNPYATAGGDDAETDESLRERARLFFSTARRGTSQALEAAALGVPGVRAAKAFEMLDSYGRPARFVELVVTDSFTEQFIDYATIPPRYETQSQMLATRVWDALADVRAFGVYVQVHVANVILQAIQLSLAFQAGTDVNAAALLSRAAVVNYTNSLAPGTTWRREDCQELLRRVSGLSYTGNEIVSPSGDVIATPHKVIRTSLSLVSAASAQTDQPIITGINPDAYTLAS